MEIIVRGWSVFLIMSASRAEIALILGEKALGYQEAKSQASHIDRLLGYTCEPIEQNIRATKTLGDSNSSDDGESRQFWIGLDIQSMQTPYSEIVELVEALDPQDNECWIDLGAAYGRIGVVLGFLKPQISFVGYEYVQVRVDEGRRIYSAWNLQNVDLKQADIASQEFILPEADLYFIYDFGSKKDIYSVLEKLRVIAQSRQIRVIARGRGVKNWIYMDFPWLHKMSEPIQLRNCTIFRS